MLEATTEATMLGCTWEDNINVNLKVLEREKNGWIHSELDGLQLTALENMEYFLYYKRR
jgi:hypothetical protein